MKKDEKKRMNAIEKGQHSVERKSLIINVMVFVIISFIAVLLITEIA